MIPLFRLLSIFIHFFMIQKPPFVTSVDYISSPFPIDVVLTWVQQPSPSQYQTIQKFCPDPNTGSHIQRFRDTGTLYYSIKSILKYLPWVRKIFLVLNDHDFICWFDFSAKQNKKITLIRHSEIWPRGQNVHELPTFNSIAIESHLHRIEDLSESFLYFNDDMFVGRYLSPSSFFNMKTGAPHVWVKDLFWLPYELLEEENFIWDRDRLYSLNMTNGSILSSFYYPHDPSTPRPFPGAYMGTHGPYICTKSLITEIQSLWPNYFYHLSSQRCRTPSNTQPSSAMQRNSTSIGPSLQLQFIPPYRPPFWIYQWYLLVSNTSLPVETKVPFLNMFHLPSEFYHNILSSSKPIDFFILNDDYSTQPLKIDLEITNQRTFLEKYFDFDSLNNYLQPSEERKRFVDYRNCSLVRDQSHLSITQRRESFHEEKANFFNSIRSQNLSKSQLQWRFREIVERYREYDEWISPAAPVASSLVSRRRSAEKLNPNHTHHPLALNNFILTSPIEVGHFSDSRETSLSGPLSFEGIESLTFHEKDNEEQYVVLPLIIFNGNGITWQVSCASLTQLISQTQHQHFHIPQAGVIILVKGISGRHSDHCHQNTSSMFELAQCLRLNYIRGTNRGPMSDDWGVLSSFVLRDIRRYDLLLGGSSDQMTRSTIPVLVMSIPVSTLSSLSGRHDQPPSSSLPNHTTSCAYRNTLWFDLWYLFGDEGFLINLKQRKLFSQGRASRARTPLELLEMIKLRQHKRLNDTTQLGSPLGSLFVGLIQQKGVTSSRTQHLWNTLQTVFKRTHNSANQYFQSVRQRNCSQNLIEQEFMLMSTERHHSLRKRSKEEDRLVVPQPEENCHERMARSQVARVELYR